MNKKAIRWRICHERFSPFLKFHNSDLEMATLHYQANIEISESFYPVLSFLEVALRDNIHQQFSKYYRNKLWLMQSKFSDQLIAAHRNRLQKVIQEQFGLPQLPKKHPTKEGGEFEIESSAVLAK